MSSPLAALSGDKLRMAKVENVAVSTAARIDESTGCRPMSDIGEPDLVPAAGYYRRSGTHPWFKEFVGTRAPARPGPEIPPRADHQ